VICTLFPGHPGKRVHIKDQPLSLLVWGPAGVPILCLHKLGRFQKASWRTGFKSAGVEPQQNWNGILFKKILPQKFM